MAQDSAQAQLSDPVEARGARTRAKQTIRRLLIAGHEALCEVGYADLRVDDVVKRAGTSRGTFYLYFSNKRDLLDALLDDLLLMVDDLGDILPVLDSKPETRRQLEIWVSTALRVLIPHAGTIKALMSADPNWDWREVTRSIEGSLGQRIRAANGVVDIAAEHVAWAISAMLVGLAVGAPTSPYGQTSVARMIHRCIVDDAD
ncbi:MAG: AcrR family transcriptional regulator [Glaciecola sp.]|jgi:AcrR family transcriptional regulator